MCTDPRSVRDPTRPLDGGERGLGGTGRDRVLREGEVAECAGTGNVGVVARQQRPRWRVEVLLLPGAAAAVCD